MSPEVSLSTGLVQGTLDEGVPCFFGIPYAQPPIGPLRFRPPVPVEPWSGMLDATERRGIAPQPPPTPGLAVPGDPTEQSEDCLHVNIWTPVVDGGNRPVMVFIHGGSFITGAGANSVYRGRWLAEFGDVVVVTINYRLGALGFLAHSALIDDDGSVGNYGLMDQIAALEWVADNIAAFGGDPGNVTVFGESAGAMSICTLLATPRARGLFHRAILQSGPHFTQSRERALTVGDRLVEALGLVNPSRADLEGIPAEDFVAATAELWSLPPEPGVIALPLLPVVDGVFLEVDPDEAIAKGSASGISVMIGTNRDEMSMFALGDPAYASIDEAGLARWLDVAMPGCDPAEVVTAYVAARTARGEPTDPSALWVAMATDVIFRGPSLVVASAQATLGERVFVYLFTQETDVFGGILGSCHALELPYVFGTIREEAINVFAGGGPGSGALSEEMMRAWTSFARTGQPETPATWAPFETRVKATRVFGPNGGLRDHPRADELEAVASAHVRKFPATGA